MNAILAPSAIAAAVKAIASPNVDGLIGGYSPEADPFYFRRQRPRHGPRPASTAQSRRVISGGAAEDDTENAHEFFRWSSLNPLSCRDRRHVQLNR
jgi:hypothetical protein